MEIYRTNGSLIGNFDSLSGADLREADLSGAEFRDADLSGAILSGAILSGADLRYADLRYADLSGADLRDAELRYADLRYADLSGADLREADLSGTKGLARQSEYLSNFEKDQKGILVYKGIGNTHYAQPKWWVIEPGSFLEESCASERTVECGCGINFATHEWIRENLKDSLIWLCRIRYEDLSDVVVPYNTDGKARCGRLELIKPVDTI